jgi:hypothetical protein
MSHRGQGGVWNTWKDWGYNCGCVDDGTARGHSLTSIDIHSLPHHLNSDVVVVHRDIAGAAEVCVGCADAARRMGLHVD